METRKKLLVCVDDISKNPKTNEIVLVGWALDQSTGMIPDIQVSSAEEQMNSSISLTHRADVNELYQLKSYGFVGFRVGLETSSKSGKVSVIFSTAAESHSEEIDLSQSFRNPNTGQWKKKIKNTIIKASKAVGYLKRNGIVNTYRRFWLEKSKSNEIYLHWIEQNEKDLGNPSKNNEANFSYKPLISIIMPVYNVPKVWLEKSILSVLNQYYTNWELCICDDASTDAHVKRTLEKYEALDSRIKVTYHETNMHICGATNSALAISEGEFIALLDDDDELAPNALFEVIKILNKNKNLDLIYSDEDKINEDNCRLEPAFKPTWSPDLLMATNYISHLGVYRKMIVEQIGGLREGFEGAQDYDLVLRFTECTDSSKIARIPKVLYHWRMLKGSTAVSQGSKDYAYEAGKKALEEALGRRGIKGKVENGAAKGFYDVYYDIKSSDLVSVIIPTKNGYNDLKKCIDSIIEKNSYANFEIIVADNGSDDPRMDELYSYYEDKLKEQFRKLSIVIPFNYSRINNLAAKEAKGKYLLFINNDTEVINPDWMKFMVSFAQFDRIGAVGAKLYYPNNIIQHSGVVVGLGGLAGHVHHKFPKGDFGYFGRLVINVNYLAVTAACMMMKKADFDKINGFDEDLAVAYNDVDLCIRCHELGKDNVWLHEAELYHYESQTRGYENTPEKQVRFLHEANYFSEKWEKYIDKGDPYYNPNLTKKSGDFSMNLD